MKKDNFDIKRYKKIKDELIKSADAFEDEGTEYGLRMSVKINKIADQIDFIWEENQRYQSLLAEYYSRKKT